MLDFITIDEQIIDDIDAMEGFCPGFSRNAIRLAVLEMTVYTLYEFTRYNARTVESIQVCRTDGTCRNVLEFEQEGNKIINSSAFSCFDENDISLQFKNGMLLKAVMTFSNGSAREYHYLIA